MKVDVWDEKADKKPKKKKYKKPSGKLPKPKSWKSKKVKRKKKKARKSTELLARELMRLYAAREKADGFAFNQDSPWLGELENSFRFEETNDQLRAIHETYEDMERVTPMDRLVCGDVGFGKTEVAIRAAFKAVLHGKQVAVLVPTTVLAQQHYNTLRERLSRYPVEIGMLSRFRTKQQRQKLVQNRLSIPISTGYRERRSRRVL